ncbi:hypothetical protein B1B04_18865 [Lysinibacillus sp. KCTC 33748]|uniref:hypothetical protein n=1 Tax=unclassified Lysinibacillus TaxID=2636778 RepID=UPI0009A832CB|nr:MULTISPECIES: hypothetical protein [unclassified Lysinibacillus]OXS70225.1 hypothetical protein B1B04_18865 [Lysinibacillus sp. KCTC 33748]SKC04898.1 hypothetical protein SAMN06295926_11962 [Lysinibacillus sp. AC-3]
MQVTDGTWTYDTDVINAAITNEYRDWYERDMLNAFTRYAYYRYKQIRDCVNTRKCKHMTIDKVREQLKINNKFDFTCNLLSISAEEIWYIVDFADQHLKYVK